jgi:hypothetical protein
MLLETQVRVEIYAEDIGVCHCCWLRSLVRCVRLFEAS